MKFLGHHKQAIDIAKALGVDVDGQHVRGVELRLFAGEVVEMTVYRYVDSDAADALVEVAEKYCLNAEKVDE